MHLAAVLISSWWLNGSDSILLPVYAATSCSSLNNEEQLSFGLFGSYRLNESERLEALDVRESQNGPFGESSSVNQNSILHTLSTRFQLQCDAFISRRLPNGIRYPNTSRTMIALLLGTRQSSQQFEAIRIAVRRPNSPFNGVPGRSIKSITLDFNLKIFSSKLWRGFRCLPQTGGMRSYRVQFDGHPLLNSTFISYMSIRSLSLHSFMTMLTRRSIVTNKFKLLQVTSLTQVSPAIRVRRLSTDLVLRNS